MKLRISFILTILFVQATTAQTHLQFEQNKTLTYPLLLEAYQALDRKYEQATLVEMGATDAGKNLHVLLISRSGNWTSDLLDTNTVRVLINNGIHPGEPDGMDASLYLAEKILEQKKVPEHVLIAIIPVYNIDGMLNRSCCSRANQNGPEEYGFRGNSQNLDLNRDFIKADSRNARSFAEIFHTIRPHLLVDTHVSNGADYQYTMTLLMTQPDKLGVQGEYCRTKLTPHLYAEMNKRGFPMTPYVNSKAETPESGIVDFLETPRFATGYAALFGCIGITSETHMLKAYPQRVKSTIALLETVIEYADHNAAELIAEKRKMLDFAMRYRKGMKHQMNFRVDTSRKSEFEFAGYEAVFEPSAISGHHRLRYDRTKPWIKKIPYYNCFVPALEIEIPRAYVVPQAWQEVLVRLQMNGVKMDTIASDTSFEVGVYYIQSYETVKHPYEGHYLHFNTKTSEEKQLLHFHPGDLLIYTRQPAWRFIVETLEPQSVDSYFNWNFFDAVLQQKEWFSDYVFEDYAKDFLKKNPEIEAELLRKKKEDPAFAADAFAQLYFVYRHSPYYEKSHNRYPVFKISE